MPLNADERWGAWLSTSRLHSEAGKRKESTSPFRHRTEGERCLAQQYQALWL
jgi:hypothetical protein